MTAATGLAREVRRLLHRAATTGQAATDFDLCRLDLGPRGDYWRDKISHATRAVARIHAGGSADRARCAALLAGDRLVEELPVEIALRPLRNRR